MRDFYTKENMRGEVFHVPGSGLVFEPRELSFETETDTGREGVIHVRHLDGKPARGYVYPSERCMRGVREQFAPAADGTGMIRWQFDARGIAPGRTVRGFFRVITPYGEYSIPYTVQVSGKGELQRRKSIKDAGMEDVRTKEDFLILAESDLGKAAELFYSGRFVGILTSEEERTLYRGLSMHPGNLQNVEEFLIAACGKEKTVYEPVEKTLYLEVQGGAGRADGRLAGSRAERALQAHRQRVRNSGLGGPQPAEQKSAQEDLVYLPLRISRTGSGQIGPVIRAEGRFFPAAPFDVPAGQESPFTVRIPVNRAALHTGRNFGRILIHGPFQEAAVPVEVRCLSSASSLRRRGERELQLMELQLMRMYVDFRLTEKPGADWFRQADRLIDDILLHSHGDLLPRLYGVHLLLLRRQYAEAERALGRIALRYAGSDAPKGSTARFPGEQEEAYCYRQYLYARCRMEDVRLCARTVRFLRGLYRQTGDWRTAWMLMDLSEEYAPGTAARWNFLRHQFENGCSSPVIFLEAWEMVREDPRILLPGSSVQERWARDDFGLHVFWFAARNNVLTDKAAAVMVSLAEKKKAFSPLLFKGLCAACGMERFGEKASLTQELPETELPPDLPRSEEADRGEQAAQSGVGTGRPSSFEKSDVQDQPASDSQVRTDGEPRMGQELLRAVCIQLVRGQDLSPQAHSWYTKARKAGVTLTKLEENWQQSIPADDSKYRLPAGHNAVLRTTAARAVRAVLVYDRFRGEETFPVRGGIAFLPVYGDANTVFLEDAQGNRYTKSLPYALDVQETEEILPGSVKQDSRPFSTASDSMGTFPAADLRQREPRLFSASLNRPDSVSPAAFRQQDPRALAALLGYGSREISGFDFSPENAAAAVSLLDSGLLTAAARTELLLDCLSASGGQEGYREIFLSKADPAQFSAPERAQLLGYLAGAGEYETALRWLTAYGGEAVDAQLLGRICLGLPWEGGYIQALLPSAWEAFERGNTQERLLNVLSEHFCGLAQELIRLRTACVETGAPSAALDRRIIRQALYSGTVLTDHALIIVSAGRKLEEAFLPAAALYADHVFSDGILMGNRMTDLLTSLLADGGEDAGSLQDICRIAYLKELSMQQGEFSERERSAAKAALSVLLSKGIVFPFFRQFPGLDDRLDLYAEETLVQYHPSSVREGVRVPAEPEKRTVIPAGSGTGTRGNASSGGKEERHIVFHYTTSRRGETGNYRARPMKEMYRDFYVSGFLLFYGEQMHYYITDDKAEKHVVQSGMIGQDARILESCSGRFGLINETTRAAALREYDEALSLLTGYYRRSYLESELFRR